MMSVCKDLSAMATLLDLIRESNDIKVLRFKDRMQNPSGGWRDAMINFRMTADPNNHVCELQLVHKQLMLVRQEMGGHHEYNVFRGALELLEANGKLDAGAAAPGAAEAKGNDMQAEVI